MTKRQLSYHGYRFPFQIISHAVWLYHRFCLSFREVEDLLAEARRRRILRVDQAVVHAIRTRICAEAEASPGTLG